MVVLSSYALACGKYSIGIGSSIVSDAHCYREMAVGNTFGATALSSYGGFWLSFAITLTPGGFQIKQQLSQSDPAQFANSFALFLFVIFFFFFFFF